MHRVHQQKTTEKDKGTRPISHTMNTQDMSSEEDIHEEGDKRQATGQPPLKKHTRLM